MISALYSLFREIETSPFAEFLKRSDWSFPVIESIHLCALALLGGAAIVLDLRLLGLGLREQPIAKIAKQTTPWLNIGLALMLISGALLFCEESTKLYSMPAFWIKMGALAVAIVFTFGTRQFLSRRTNVVEGLRLRLVGAVSLALWFTVAAAGRWIGFS